MNIEPFYITSTPQKSGEIETRFASRCPNGLVVLPPFGQTCGVLVGFDKIFTASNSSFCVNEIVGNDVMITRVKA